MRPLSAVALPVAFALAVAGPAVAKDKKPKPTQPLTVFVHFDPAGAKGDAKELKGMEDSARDVTGALRKKKDWFTVVDARNQAEVVVEIKSRAYESGHAYVLNGRVTILDLISDAKVIGQGGLGDQVFNIWRTAANDLASRVQTFCEETFPEVEKARAAGVKPAVIAATDKGDELTRKGDYAGAEAAYGEALAGSPKFARALYNRGVLFHMQKQADRAIADYGAAIAADPTQWKAHFNRALLQLEAGDADSAIAGFGEVIRLKPDEAAAYAQRGIAHVQAKIRPAARADFDKAIALAPNDPVAYLHRGTMLAEGDTPADAIPDLSAVIRMQPTNPDAWFQRGYVRAKLGRIDEAIADYDQALILNPKDATAWYNRGLLHFKKKAVKQAEADRLQAARLDPALAGKKYR